LDEVALNGIMIDELERIRKEESARVSAEHLPNERLEGYR
jgi:hypothetical protein